MTHELGVFWVSFEPDQNQIAAPHTCIIWKSRGFCKLIVVEQIWINCSHGPDAEPPRQTWNIFTLQDFFGVLSLVLSFQGCHKKWSASKIRESNSDWQFGLSCKCSSGLLPWTVLTAQTKWSITAPSFCVRWFACYLQPYNHRGRVVLQSFDYLFHKLVVGCMV